jgi:hypothetical protein
MTRQSISEKDLLDIISNHLLTLNACRNFRYTSLLRVSGSLNGANWELGDHRASGPDNDPVDCAEKIADFIRDLQGKYDVH